MEIRLVDDWKRVLRKAWSVKFNILTILLGAAEAILPMLETGMPRGVFAGLSALTAGLSLTARVLSQQEFRDDQPTK